MDKSPFKKLPAELRNIVYEYALVHHCSIVLAGGNTVWTKDESFRLRPLPALTRTCKHVRGECLPIFFNANHFEYLVDINFEPSNLYEQPALGAHLLTQRFKSFVQTTRRYPNVIFQNLVFRATVRANEDADEAAAALKCLKQNLRQHNPNVPLAVNLESRKLMWFGTDNGRYRIYTIPVMLSGTSLERVAKMIRDSLQETEAVVCKVPNQELAAHNQTEGQYAGDFAWAVMEWLHEDPEWDWL